MTTLEQLGYVADNGSYVKHIDRFKIVLSPSGNDFVRRIFEHNLVIDIRKVQLNNLENDKAFFDMLRRRNLATQPIPKEKNTEIVLGKRNEVTKPFRGLSQETNREV